MPPQVAFLTLGCKLNQLETEALADAFAREGAAVSAFDEGRGEGLDLVVINTCTVTGKAEQKARRLVRAALAADPRTAVLVTGCYAQVDAALLAAVDPRVLVLEGGRKDALLGLPVLLASWREDSGARGIAGDLRAWLSGLAARGEPGGNAFAFNPASFAFHSRPALKIEDGCDNDCAFCRVHIARGRARSLPAEMALARARALEEAGRAEIVLTGVNLSQYRDGELDLPGLLRRLVDGTERVHFRLSSYEPDRIDGPFLEAFALPRVRPHLHLAVQSASDSVLESMGRRYRGADVLAAVRALRVVKNDPFLAADLIAGFPGETDRDAATTLEFAGECGFAWIHAFRFSPRPGTRGASLGSRVPERVAGERARALQELASRGRAAYVERWRGRLVTAVLEGPADQGIDPRSREMEATSDNYLKLLVGGLGSSDSAGRAVTCRIGGANGTNLPAGIDEKAVVVDGGP